MKSKIQGEGDYASAQEFNEKQRQFVRRGGANKRPNGLPVAEAAAAEQAGKRRAKRPEQDRRDAALMSNLVGKSTVKER